MRIRDPKTEEDAQGDLNSAATTAKFVITQALIRSARHTDEAWQSRRPSREPNGMGRVMGMAADAGSNGMSWNGMARHDGSDLASPALLARHQDPNEEARPDQTREFRHWFSHSPCVKVMAVIHTTIVVPAMHKLPPWNAGAV
ncbi:hypothetical protein CSOJ01_14683 [Colletotrichum sojae]|uniref:Uncharacterized protein n=1 Tax=Colletotrichum sojae TaxID=2175907 RepID=A0A8H6IQ13_9PEZI|nr:hypothetical protein CSOJ01_14683 [Colletotrichum sojae]